MLKINNIKINKMGGCCGGEDANSTVNTKGAGRKPAKRSGGTENKPAATAGTNTQQPASGAK